MNDTRANQWIPVSERLPEDSAKRYIVVNKCGAQLIAFIQDGACWHASGACSKINDVTHWMDLPEPPAPPKPEDPFEAWWESYPTCETQSEAARAAWNAAKEHYAKPLPDFETWAKAHCADGPYLEVEKGGRLINERAAKIVWNAAQGKPEE